MYYKSVVITVVVVVVVVDADAVGVIGDIITIIFIITSNLNHFEKRSVIWSLMG